MANPSVLRFGLFWSGFGVRFHLVVPRWKEKTCTKAGSKLQIAGTHQASLDIIFRIFKGLAKNIFHHAGQMSCLISAVVFCVVFPMCCSVSNSMQLRANQLNSTS